MEKVLVLPQTTLKKAQKRPHPKLDQASDIKIPSEPQSSPFLHVSSVEDKKYRPKLDAFLGQKPSFG